MKIEFIDRKSGEIRGENPPAEGLLKFLYQNPLGKWTLLSLVKRKFISAWYGRKMDNPKSKKRIQPFVDELNIDLSESVKSIDEFISFNDFFYRKLKSEARPIENHFVSPGDGRVLAFKNVSDVNQFYIKGRKFTLSEFLDDKQIENQFENGSMIILRLAPNDYHRFHFPTDGIPSEIKKINGNYFSVSPYALKSNFTKVFCENKREICVLKTQQYDKIALIPIGATMVGSIVETFEPNQPVKKGDEMGYFAFGGSTVVVLAQENCIKIDADILENTRNKMETFVKMGQKIAE